RASTGVAGGAIGDALRRDLLVERLRVPAPSAAAVAEFAATYAAVPLRDLPGGRLPAGVDPGLALGLLPAKLARPVIVSALRRAAGVERYAGWAEARQHAALRELRCVRDRLPTVGSVPLMGWMPFLEPVAGSS
ncbi:MAG: hypothetical protein ACYC1P_06170, partial [Gaiellaceae bacterium]